MFVFGWPPLLLSDKYFFGGRHSGNCTGTEERHLIWIWGPGESSLLMLSFSALPPELDLGFAVCRSLSLALLPMRFPLPGTFLPPHLVLPPAKSIFHCLQTCKAFPPRSLPWTHKFSLHVYILTLYEGKARKFLFVGIWLPTGRSCCQ